MRGESIARPYMTMYDSITAIDVNRDRVDCLRHKSTSLAFLFWHLSGNLRALSYAGFEFAPMRLPATVHLGQEESSTKAAAK